MLIKNINFWAKNKWIPEKFFFSLFKQIVYNNSESAQP